MTRTDAMPSERKFLDAAIGSVAPDGTFSGYASLFGVADLGGDVVEKGAFSATLARRGPRGVRMLFQHDPGQPIGTWISIAEDDRGLFVRGRLTSDVPKAREIHALMKAGALDGLSIGFRTTRARPGPGRGTRRILEADLWEISVVTFPMLPSARIDRVKAADGARAPDFASLATLIRAAARNLQPNEGQR